MLRNNRPETRKDSDIFERACRQGKRRQAGEVEKVREILENVRKNGDRAVLEYTRKFDGVDLDAPSLAGIGELRSGIGLWCP